MIPNSVRCEITGIEHFVVTQSQNVAMLIDHLKHLIERLNNGQKVNIAIDCEGYELGWTLDSLKILQFAECYENGYPDSQNSIQLKSGFLVMAPFSAEIQQLLSTVFSHSNIRLVMFAMEGDASMLVARGIKMNFRNIIDCQKFTKPPKGLVFTVEVSNKMIEYRNAMMVMQRKINLNFDKFYYDNQNTTDPFNKLLDQYFWIYSANDIALTALSLAGAMQFSSLPNLISRSNNAASELEILINQYGPLGPTMKNNFAYPPPYVNGRIPNLEVAYKLFTRARHCIENYSIYRKLCPYDKQFSLMTLQQAMNKARNYIERY